MAKALSVTYRKERAIFDHVADVICSFDRTGRITEINPACKDSWGYDPSDLIGKFFLNLVDPGQRLDTAKVLRAGAESNEKFWFETNIVRKDGSFVVVRWSGYWSQLDRNFFCVAHDITQQKYLEQTKAEFLSMISHDLRTPLCSISSFLDLLASGIYSDVPPSITQAAAQGQRSVRRLIKLTEDLLQLERMESGCWPLEVTSTDIADVIVDAIGSIKQSAENMQVSIDTSRVTSTPVEVDSGRLTQVIVNLLSNAIKFSPPDSRVEVRTKSGADFVEVAIIDHGRGIPDHLHSAVFDRFKQVELKDSRKGSGLGLAIAKTIVEQHGGKIGFQSKPGCGSRFWFQVPLATSATNQTMNFEHADPLLTRSVAAALAV